MANQCVEYKLHRNEEGKLVAPSWINDPGHCYNPADKSLIGFIAEDRDWYVPDTITYLTKEEFINRCITMHETNPFTQPDTETYEPGTVLTTDEVTAWATQFFDNRTGA